MNFDRIASKLRDRYVFRRRQKYPQYVCDELRYSWDFWLSVAQVVHALGAEPEAFVDMLFDVSWDKRSTDMPPPNLLKSNVHINNWKAKPRVDSAQAEQALDSMFKLFSSYLQAGVPAVVILTDDQLYFNPVFRYAMARRMGLLQLAANLEAEAKEFCTQRPTYLLLLKSFLPEGFNAAQ